MKAVQVVALDISLATNVRGAVQPFSAKVRKPGLKVAAVVVQKPSFWKASKPSFAAWHALAVPADAQKVGLLTVGLGDGGGGGTAVGLLTVGLGDGGGGGTTVGEEQLALHVASAVQ